MSGTKWRACRIVYVDALGNVRWIMGCVDREELAHFELSPNDFLEVRSGGGRGAYGAQEDLVFARETTRSVIPKAAIRLIELYTSTRTFAVSPSQKALFRPLPQEF